MLLYQELLFHMHTGSQVKCICSALSPGSGKEEITIY